MTFNKAKGFAEAGIVIQKTFDSSPEEIKHYAEEAAKQHDESFPI